MDEYDEWRDREWAAGKRWVCYTEGRRPVWIQSRPSVGSKEATLTPEEWEKIAVLMSMAPTAGGPEKVRVAEFGMVYPEQRRESSGTTEPLQAFILKMPEVAG